MPSTRLVSRQHNYLYCNTGWASVGAQMLCRAGFMQVLSSAGAGAGLLAGSITRAASPTNSILGAGRMSSSCPNCRSRVGSCAGMEALGMGGSSVGGRAANSYVRGRSRSCHGQQAPTWLARVASANFRAQQLVCKYSAAAIEGPTPIQEERGVVARQESYRSTDLNKSIALRHLHWLAKYGQGSCIDLLESL